MSAPSAATIAGQIWWHGGKERLDLATISWSHKTHGGLHLGTQAQAEQRGRVLTAFRIDGPVRLRTSRDRGGDWAKRARAARGQGYDALLYLNRYEGIGTLPDIGDLDTLDALTNTQFTRLVPLAAYSLIILRAAVVRPLSLDATIAAAA